jgi:hypothetical protein
MDLMHVAIKVRKQRVTLAYRLLVAASATMTNQNPILWQGVHSIWSNPIWSGPIHVHSPLSPPPYGHYAKIIIIELQPRSVHYNDVSTRDRLTTSIRSIPTKSIFYYTF